ncbi:MAG TPA: lysophospholipid acyltransferase family protein [Gemmatimonadales bacterium]|nr:lysophospholipid acyltransferase family protein [Gemmatimonadales bacterium]
MIRTLWYYVVLFLSTIVHASGAVIAGLFRVKNRRGGIYDWASEDWSRDILKAAGTPVEAEGLERIPRDQPLMYVSNHSSMFDIWALAATLRSVRFVAKKELFKIPLLGPAMRAAGHIPIDREARKKAFEAYDEAARLIQSGASSPVVFPEGTRSRTGELLPFKNAPFGLAIAAQVPIVPVYVHHTFEILPKGAWRLRPRPIKLLVGEPMETKGLQPADRERLRDQVRAAMVALQSKVR